MKHVSEQIKILNETTLHLTEGMISPPWSQLTLFKDNVSFLNSMLNISTQANLKLINLSDEIEQNLKKKFKYAYVKVSQYKLNIVLNFKCPMCTTLCLFYRPRNC